MSKLELDLTNISSKPKPEDIAKIQRDVKEAEGILIVAFSKTQNWISIWICGWMSPSLVIQKLMEIRKLCVQKPKE